MYVLDVGSFIKSLNNLHSTIRVSTSLLLRKVRWLFPLLSQVLSHPMLYNGVVNPDSAWNYTPSVQAKCGVQGSGKPGLGFKPRHDCFFFRGPALPSGEKVFNV